VNVNAAFHLALENGFRFGSSRSQTALPPIACLTHRRKLLIKLSQRLTVH